MAPEDEEHPYDATGDCLVCGAEMEWVQCRQCHGEGGWHDCGECTCPCLDKEEITVDCDECDGAGGYRECVALPHTEEQMAEYRAKPEGGAS